MTAKPQWVIDLEKQPCECVPCGECGGTGCVWWDDGGRRYLGRNRWDDLDEIESCDYCENGMIEECDRCAQLLDYDNCFNEEG